MPPHQESPESLFLASHVRTTNRFISANIAPIVTLTASSLLIPEETAANLIQRILLMTTFHKLIVMAADNLHAKDQRNLSVPPTPKDPSRAA